MDKDVVEGGQAAGAGCLGVGGIGVFDGAACGGGSEEVPQRLARDVVGVGGDDDDDEGVRRGGGEVAYAEGVQATESAEGGCSCLGGGEGEMKKEIAPLAGRDEGLIEVASKVFTWGGVNGESRGGGVVFLSCRGNC